MLFAIIAYFWLIDNWFVLQPTIFKYIFEHLHFFLEVVSWSEAMLILSAFWITREDDTVVISTSVTCQLGGLALSLLSLVLVIVFIIKPRSVVNWLVTGITSCTRSWNFAKYGSSNFIKQIYNRTD